MKNIIIILVICITQFSAYSQDCKNELNVPKELTRNRYQEIGEVDRHPFTMFKMDTKDFDYTLNS